MAEGTEDFDGAFDEAVAVATSGVTPDPEPKDEAPKDETPPKDEPPKDEAPKDETPPKDEPPKDESPKDETPPKDEPPKDEPPKDETPPKDEPPKDEPPKDETPPKAPAPKPKDEPQETAEQKAERERVENETKAALADYEFSDDEKKHIAQWEKDFPTESVAIKAMFKQLDRVVTQRVYRGANAVLERVYADFAPVAKGFTEQSEQQHFTAIRTAHSDFDAVLPEVEKWVDTQPKYLQTGMKQALNEGSAQDVIDVVTRYKAAAGKAPATPATPAAPAKPAAPSKDDVDALAAVPGGRRPAPTTRAGVAKDDYDGAFDEATGKK